MVFKGLLKRPKDKLGIENNLLLVLISLSPMMLNRLKKGNKQINDQIFNKIRNILIE